MTPLSVLFSLWLCTSQSSTCFNGQLVRSYLTQKVGVPVRVCVYRVGTDEVDVRIPLSRSCPITETFCFL